MTRFRVEAEFASPAYPSATQIVGLMRLMKVHDGDVFGRPAGWRMSVFLSEEPGAADAAFTATEIFDHANALAAMPAGVLVDLHVNRVGGLPARAAARGPAASAGGTL